MSFVARMGGNRAWPRFSKIGILAGSAVLVGTAIWSSNPPQLEWPEWVTTRLNAPANPPQIVAPQNDAQVEAQVQSLVVVTAERAVASTPLILGKTSPGRNNTEGTTEIGSVAGHLQTYSAGALLSNGARLKEIHRDRVVLERDGRAAVLSAAQDQRNRDSLLQLQPEDDSVLTSSDSSETLTDLLRPSPVFDGQRLHGMRVQPGSRSDAFSQLGLQAGDVITALDGVPLTDRKEAVAALRRLTDGATLMATVERNGAPLPLLLSGSAPD